MNRLLLTCAMALISSSAAAQTATVRSLDDSTGGLLIGTSGPGQATSPPGFHVPESEEQALRRLLLESLHARVGQMSPEQLRRALAVIEGDDAPLPPAAEEVLQAYREQAGTIQQEANRKISVHRRQAIADLREIQDRLTRDGKLDEAVAVRDLIRSLSPQPANVQPDPGSLMNHRDQRGRPLYFRVTGSTLGSVWGSDVYTDDSTLAAAAVHSGVLRNGQTGIVRVIVLPGRDSYAGATRNGVTTSNWGSFSGSYRVERAGVNEDLADPLEEPPANDGAPGGNPAADLPPPGGVSPAATPASPGHLTNGSFPGERKS
ncbi:MAG TPA: LCCL domain-containing protein [Planctomycetaceae bacterium]|nr:LCCL domain-containing protein [Planctomycetaceae bacterium]